VPPRGWSLRLQDILESIERVEKYTHGLTFADFAADEQVVDAVVRNLTIIGEAARCVLPDAEQLAPEIPWRDLRDLRNFVVHAYHAVRLRTVWETVQKDLPPLVQLLQARLEDEQA